MITSITVTGDWLAPDGGTPGEGTVQFALSGEMTDSETFETVPKRTLQIDIAAGVIAVPILANNDPTTLPTNTFYNITENIVGATVLSYPAVIPYNAADGTIDLAQLRPAP